MNSHHDPGHSGARQDGLPRNPATGRPEPDAKTVNRAVAASAIGNATEWFDYGVYAVSVVYITQNFFPGEYCTILALSTFAFSFLVRPLGGLFWGPLGDRLGRKRILALTIILMAGATFCIGLIPSVETIGIAAPILLILLRAVQGFSTGGEYGGAATFMAEYAPDKKRGFYGSFLEFGTLAGFNGGALLMLALTWNLSEAQLLYAANDAWAALRVYHALGLPPAGRGRRAWRGWSVAGCWPDWRGASPRVRGCATSATTPSSPGRGR